MDNSSTTTEPQPGHPASSTSYVDSKANNPVVLSEGGQNARVQDDLEIAQLAGALAHEIRNPLSTIKLNLDLIAEDLQAAPDHREKNRTVRRLEAARKESQRLEDLLDDFLRFIRAGSLPLSISDINLVIEDIRDFCEPASMANQILTRLQLATDLPPLPLHVDSFKQALLNLIRNAQYSMPDGGELILRTRREPESIAIDIADTGTGIPPESLSRIFEPYFTTRSRGSGLGLPITRRIVEAHGGRVDVQSLPGKGTQFTIHLPCPQQEGSETRRP